MKILFIIICVFLFYRYLSNNLLGSNPQTNIRKTKSGGSIKYQDAEYEDID